MEFTIVRDIGGEFFRDVTGVYNSVNWTGVGTINQVSLIPNDQYGGVPGSTVYPVTSASSSLGGVQTTTISLNQNSSYFGMEWSAADLPNAISFYNNGTLVAELDTAQVFTKVPAGWPSPYQGNPNLAFAGLDYGEQFSFINFFGSPATSWNEVQISNPSYTGFESQDWTSRMAAWNPTTDGALPGTPEIQINNGVVSSISSVPMGFVSVPGAPTPPMNACLAFATVILLRSLFQRRQTECRVSVTA